MNNQNILNYRERHVDLVLDTSNVYDLTLNTDQIIEYMEYPDGLVSGSSISINSDVLGRFELGYTYMIKISTEKLEALEDDVLYQYLFLGPETTGEQTDYIDNTFSLLLTKIGNRYKVGVAKGADDELECGEYNLTIKDYFTDYFMSTDELKITVTFERFFPLTTQSNLFNYGGVYKLMTDPEDKTKLTLNRSWFKDAIYRLGTFKIFVNGLQLFVDRNFHETVFSERGENVTYHLELPQENPFSKYPFVGFDAFKFYKFPLNPYQIKHNNNFF